MKRVEQHTIDAAGKRLLREALEPLGWTLNETEADYGVDFDVEVFSAGMTTGITFKLQLKSSRSSSYSADGQFVSQNLDIDSARYLAGQLKAPVLVVHADVDARRLFWAAPQIDVHLKSKIEKSAGRTVTIRLPTANELPRDATRLLDTLARMALHLATEVIAAAPISEFVTSVTEGPDAQRRSAEFLKKAEILKLNAAQDLIRGGQDVEAVGYIEAVRCDATATIEARFAAELMHYAVQTHVLGVMAPQSAKEELARGSINRLSALTRKGPKHLKLYALIRREALMLGALVERGWGLMMNSQVQERDEERDPLWLSALRFQLAANWLETARRYRRLIRLTEGGIRSTHAWALGNAIAEVPRVLVRLVARLDAGDERDAATSYRLSGFNWCKLVLSLGIQANDLSAISSALLTAVMFSNADDQEPALWARDNTARVQRPATRRELEQMLDEIGRRRDKQKQKPESIEEEFEIQRQIYTSMAESVGVDLNDPNDRIAWVLRLGLTDLDPSRVLRTCEHIFITLGPQGLPAQWLAMPTAASKTLHCTRHRFAVGSMTLDGALGAMQGEHCSKCSDCSPRPDTWKYSHDWQNEQDERYAGEFRDPFGSGLMPGRNSIPPSDD